MSLRAVSSFGFTAFSLEGSIIPNAPFAKDGQIVADPGRYAKVDGQYFFITFFYTFYALSLLSSFVFSMLFLYHFHGLLTCSPDPPARRRGLADHQAPREIELHSMPKFRLARGRMVWYPVAALRKGARISETAVKFQRPRA